MAPANKKVSFKVNPAMGNGTVFALKERVTDAKVLSPSNQF